MLRTLCPLVLAGVLLGCGQSDPGGQPTSPTGPEASEPASAWPELLLKRNGGRIAVVLRAVKDRRPRMVAVRVRWSEGWGLAAHQPGQAALAAGKQVHVQLVGPTEARVVVFASDNTRRIEDGTLAELSLEGAGPGSVQIVPSAPMLAPAEAEAGLHLGDLISL